MFPLNVPAALPFRRAVKGGALPLKQKGEPEGVGLELGVADGVVLPVGLVLSDALGLGV